MRYRAGMSTFLEAELVATGDELLTGATADTNGAFAAGALREAGAVVGRMTTVGDRQAAIETALREASSRVTVVVVSGGLGPTEDDRTARAAAAVAGVPLVRNEAALAHVRGWFARHQLAMTPNNEKQADLPAGCEVLDNPAGTAVGFSMPLGEARLFFLPGVPHEYRRMMAEQVVPRVAALGARHGRGRLALRVLRLYGIGESKLETRLCGVALPAGIEVGYRPTWPELHLRLYAAGEGDSKPELDAAEQAVRERLGPLVYGTGDAGLASTVGELLLRRGWSLAVAESCTGGLLGATVTEVAGSSRWFVGGVIAYANPVKTTALGVDTRTLEAHGAVSEQVACLMASGARERLGADAALSITGIAGPDGGTTEKPVGSAWIGLATREGVEARPYRLRGDRQRVRLAAAWAALERLRRHLLAIPEDR
ncbi:MAG: competence/damage-inducible protein A [Candidatus Riflebacteria bacterium]|nr:competence/damage-inducible protein A [Candidatus Riflebacteria bacterium]